jgi:hypothetical protein
MNNRTPFTAHITKYALTVGIQTIEVIGCSDTIVTDVKIRATHYHAPHRSKQDAIAQAEKMRTAKIASLKKSIAKIEKIDFRKGDAA